MRIVITGCKGQLGLALQDTLPEHDLLCLDLPEHDICQAGAIRRLIGGFRPEVVVHSAAMTNVDGCEQDPDAAYRINALGTQNVALACQAAGAAMVYISTNEVFDGEASTPYLEWDRPNPVGAYGRSKWAGEQFTQMLLQRFYIVRTAWLYARGGNNFPLKIAKAARERGRLSVVTDEVSSPTYAPDLARAVVQLVGTGQYGIYHFTNEGVCSRYDFAREVLQLSGLGHVPMEPITAAQYQRVAKPPLYAPIRNFCGAALGITLRPWAEALREYFA
ncbi:MAG: dTDP-4-dehydrorhamnose reductase [Chloroflexi bacterium]|nr:dTDP-4-dehydrorhamnose reductase [Chloroflexota bacterium]